MHGVSPRCRPARARSRLRSDSGSVAVEFALVLPLLVMLLLGTVTAGLTYSHGIGLSNAVREGARFGATGDSASGSWTSDVTNTVRGTQFDDGAAAAQSTTSVCVQRWTYSTPSTPPTNAGAGAATCSPGNSSSPSLTMPDKDTYPKIPPSTSTGTCVVRVLAARKFTITLGVFPSISGTLTRGSVARYERSNC